MTVSLDGKARYEVEEKGEAILLSVSGAEIPPAQREVLHARDTVSPIVSIEPKQQGSGAGACAKIWIRLRGKRPFDVVDKGESILVSVKTCEQLPECSLEQPIRKSCNGEPVQWLKSLSMAWRQEYVTAYLPGYLFRQDDAFHAIEPEGELNRSSEEEPDPEAGCEDLCRSGDQHLAAGLLPEALAQYKRAVEQGCPDVPQGCRPQMGLLKTNLAMGRFLDAKRIFLRLSARRGGRQEPLLLLTEAVLNAFDQKFRRASELFMDSVPTWHLCPNLEGIAGLALYHQGRSLDARNVFRVARGSPWKDIRDFGTLGLADCYRTLGRCEEAEALYETLAAERSPLGWLGRSEFQIRQKDFGGALSSLGMLRKAPVQDYWKGVALAYWMSLKLQQEDWGSALKAAETDQALVLPDFWARFIKTQTVAALAGRVRSLWETGSLEEILLLAHQWPTCLDALPFSAQVCLAKTYESLGMYRSAVEVYSRFTTDPASLFQGARLAWKAEEYGKAETLLKKYFASGDKELRENAKMLGVSLLFHLNRPRAAKKYLRGIGFSGEPDLLAAVGEVEESLGMIREAIRHYQAALEASASSEQDHRTLLRKIANLYYRQGQYAQSLAYASRSLGMNASEKSSTSEPIEVLSLLRLEKKEKAGSRAERLPSGLGAKVVKEVVAAEDLTTTLQRQGYAFSSPAR